MDEWIDLVIGNVVTFTCMSRGSLHKVCYEQLTWFGIMLNDRYCSQNKVEQPYTCPFCSLAFPVHLLLVPERLLCLLSSDFPTTPF